ncbi:hypothetical protein [Rhizobium paknamense]|uniref:Uncharacterized protein n=1 Tax=Rhizobium paknamense TaxID=1206817 RepID=A0ABU0IG73_9HYPH|nr:hypothetical protein [Rhizobium paknamense]MDQ0457151.1 hypothetical protein [Rhizobium paknamense]
MIEGDTPQSKGLSARADVKTRYLYLQEEMKTARMRIDEEIRTMNQFEILSIIAIGLIYWFLVGGQVKNTFVVGVVSFFPVLISIYGIFRYRAHAEIIQINEKYIKFHIERTIFGKSSLKGIVKYYDRKKTGNLKIARYVFWILISIIAICIFTISVVSPEKIMS